MFNQYIYNPSGLPDHFDLPFTFQGDPVMKASINGLQCNRCVLDTGAAMTVLVICQDPGIKMQILDAQHALIKSLRIGGIEFGPLLVRVKRSKFDRPDEFAIYLGMEQLKHFCITLDYAHSFAHFSREHKILHSGFTKIEFFRGRAGLSFNYLNKDWCFIIDTGSNANWLFFDAQNDLPLISEEASHEKRDIPTGFGMVKLQRSISLKNMHLAGLEINELPFLLTNAEGFGGAGAPEDGIIGTGSALHHFANLQTLDFISMKYIIH